MSSCDINCTNGNCIGCKNGETWCGDPRCYPYCTDCLPNEGNHRLEIVVFVLLLVSFVLLLLGLYYLYGNYRVYKFVRK